MIKKRSTKVTVFLLLVALMLGVFSSLLNVNAEREKAQKARDLIASLEQSLAAMEKLK